MRHAFSMYSVVWRVPLDFAGQCTHCSCCQRCIVALAISLNGLVAQSTVCGNHSCFSFSVLTESHLNESESIHFAPINVSNSYHFDGGGCNVRKQPWCLYVPAIELWQFLVGFALVSIGYPIGNVMSYSIFSKILGSAPQVSGSTCSTFTHTHARAHTHHSFKCSPFNLPYMLYTYVCIVLFSFCCGYEICVVLHVLSPCLSTWTPLPGPAVPYPSFFFLSSPLFHFFPIHHVLPPFFLSCPRSPLTFLIFALCSWSSNWFLLCTSPPILSPSIALLHSLLTCSSSMYLHTLTGHNDGVVNSCREFSPNHWSSLCQFGVWQLWSTGVICSLYWHSGNSHCDSAGVL